MVGPLDLSALVLYCSVLLVGQNRDESKTSTSESFELLRAYLLFRLILN
jgi:hypothetical protein